MTIGVFDSGKGGRLIADKISHALPQAKIIFKSDPEYFPYGNKSPRIILDRLVHFTQAFIAENCSLIVIACNSATTNAIKQLRTKFPRLSLVGIEPPIKPITQLTKTGKIAIMGTSATIATVRKDASLHAIACPGLAEAIEANHHPRPATAALLHQFLDQPIAAGVDVVGLACTHYPYLLDQMRSLYPQVQFYDPTPAVVARVVKLAHDSVAQI
ncbi:MAG: hypothetical protein A2784_05160 [Candidatus Chisholmbacteria bacterium RIFCSPHIGHO2_01_FULL_48_12]|uniref:Uncharacterized protein n=1 Tax=Candidatus Chisholmbacteria bacterium RIFCSPHIGHO2_01_FULL_48_12 TaxID=1797589 RepID=A0A1G1VQ62_9BACT|nr:MAG: hypothetical protein A2784_05160 [Candidatus Chisholmbacteria bacterium RIFCSPHIGHO2_01_FULL_48_12]